MAHSSAITDMKEEAVRQLLNCKMFVDALDAKHFDAVDDLVGTHIFTYPINPEYHENPKTFLMITTRIPKVIRNDKMYTHPRLVIDIVSHMEHMKIDRKQFNTGCNRNDFISQIIDHLFNSDRTSERKFGFFGQLDLVENNEGYFTKDWVYRHMEFETLDFNKALCDCKTEEFFGKYGYEVPDYQELEVGKKIR